MKSSSPAAVTELMSRCSVGSAISITSNSCMRYEGVVVSVSAQDELICLNNVRSFGTEGRRRDSALVLPDDRVFDNIQFRGSDIKEWRLLSAAPTVQVVAFLHDPAIIQCHPLHLASTSGGSAQDIDCSYNCDFDLNRGNEFTIEGSIPSASSKQALTSFRSSSLSTNNWKQPIQGVGGILGGVTRARPQYSLDIEPSSAENNWKRTMPCSNDDISLNHSLSSRVPLISSTPFQTSSPYISPSLASAPLTLDHVNLSLDKMPAIVALENFRSPGSSFRSSESMASKNQIPETIHSDESGLSSQENPSHVFPSVPPTVSSLHLRDGVPKDTAPDKALVPGSGSRESKGRNKPIPSLSTHAKSLKLASQERPMSLSLASAEKMYKDNVHDNRKIDGQPERHIGTPMVRPGKAKDAGQTDPENTKKGSADCHTFPQRQPRKICSFGRTSKVSQLPANYHEECCVSSLGVNGKFEKPRVYNHSSKIENAKLEAKGNIRNIYVRKSEKVHAKGNDLSGSPVSPEWELAKRNSKMPDQQEIDAEESHSGSAADKKDQPAVRSTKFGVSGVGRGRSGGNTGRSQAESIGKHVT
ncbi:hypothetical protein MLD38_023990 [Melastoma candidum]|uniref:Uncharacterized protein n=1 Tax=Melastoma candidum TaxID=119954 RepID=A0ACB9NQQ3_9MYRT|nr:hypothetical protein MLD38_023990 [Melastoma candidum]